MLGTKEFATCFKEIYDFANHQEKGILYKCIFKILSNKHGFATQLCKDFQIDSNALIEDDVTNIGNLIRSIIDVAIPTSFIDHFIRFSVTALFNIQNEEVKKMKKILLIVAIAFGLVGIYYLLTQNKKRLNLVENEDNTETQEFTSFQPVSLCLILSSSAISNLQLGKRLDVSDLKYIIDNALYFKCVENHNIETIENSLVFTNDSVEYADEMTRVYIRININESNNMIGNNSQYKIKNSLQPTTKGKVEKISCLKYLSGLSNFHEI